MKVQIIETGAIVEYEDSYALRLIEQGDATLVSGDTPVTPQPEPIDPSQYGNLIEELQSQVATLQGQIRTTNTVAVDDRWFPILYQAIAQAQERKLEYDESLLQEEIDAMAGEE